MGIMLKYLALSPFLSAQIFLASLLANILGLAPALYGMQIYNRYMTSGVLGTLIALSVGMLLAATLDLLLHEVQKLMVSSVTARIEREMGERLFHVLTHARSHTLLEIPQERVTQISRAFDQFLDAYSVVNILAVVEFPFVIVYVLAAGLMSPGLGFASLLVALLSGVAIWITSTRMRSQAETLSAAMGGQSRVFASAQAIDTVRAFNGASRLACEWRKEFAATRAARHYLSWGQVQSQSVMQVSSYLMYMVVVALGARLTLTGDLDSGSLFGVSFLAYRVMAGINRLAMISANLVQGGQALDMVNQFLQIPLESTSGSALAQFSGKIEFKDVTFGYRNAPAPLIESLHLDLPPGRILQVVGANGTGKTTFARLILGLLHPVRGSILVDGLDLRQVLPDWWRKQILYLPQEPTFLVASLRTNLSTLRPDVNEADIRAALVKVGLGKYLDESQEGLDTYLADGGRHLSLGIRRRLAIARALLSDGRIVLFDEPMEGLDPEGWGMMGQILNELATQGRTLILCTSASGSIQAASLILDLNQKPTPKVYAFNPASTPREAGA